ncbi:MAG: septum formation initiator family protein [Oscillospiraceae bacterium]|nr:septum formation initiator family protein [Oscillospiraceae bacterium]
MKTASAKKPPLIRPQLILCVFLGLSLALTVTLARTLGDLHSSKTKAASLRAQVETARAQGEALRRQRTFMETDSYIEREARVEYGLSMPGTIRFVAETQPSADQPPYGTAVEVFSASDEGITP